MAYQKSFSLAMTIFEVTRSFPKIVIANENDF